MVNSLVLSVIAHHLQNIAQRGIRDEDGPGPIVNQSCGNFDRNIRRGRGSNDIALTELRRLNRKGVDGEERGLLRDMLQIALFGGSYVIISGLYSFGLEIGCDRLGRGKERQ